MKRSLKTILSVGLLAGTLDIAAAMIRYSAATGKDPIGVLRFIASGLFGNEAFSGGVMMVIYGLIFHFTIAICWTTLYFFLYPRLKLASADRYLAAIVYGAVIWCGMNLIMLPFSHVPQRPFTIWGALDSAAILMVCVGLPIARGIHKHYAAAEV